MALNQKALDTLESVLTPNERAVIWLRAWCAGENPDHRLRSYCPPQDRATFDAIIAGVEEGTGQVHQQLVILLEWLAMLEQAIHALRTVMLFVDRIARLERNARKLPPPIEPPWDTGRTVPLAVGIATPTDVPTPTTWDEYIPTEAAAITSNLRTRWGEALTYERFYAELEEHAGPGLQHYLISDLVGPYRAHCERLAAEMDGLGFPVGEPAISEERLEALRGCHAWDRLRRGSGGYDPRTGMHQTLRDSLAEFEQQQAASLRGGS